MTQHYIFKSGDDEGPDVRCYDCGRPFRDSVRGHRVGDSVTCDCGHRCATITGTINELVTELVKDFFATL